MGPVFSHRILTVTTLLIFLQTNTYSHEVGARGSQILDWHSDEISRVVSPRDLDFPEPDPFKLRG